MINEIKNFLWKSKENKNDLSKENRNTQMNWKKLRVFRQN
jgi:hypothetical protein